MKMRTLIQPALVVAAGLLLGITTTTQADSGHISIILHDDGSSYDLGYRSGGHGGHGNRHRHHDHGHHYGHHSKPYWQHDHRHHAQRVHHYSHHDGHRGGDGNGRHGDFRHEKRRHRS